MIPKKKSRKIVVNGVEYRYVVSIYTTSINRIDINKTIITSNSIIFPHYAIRDFEKRNAAGLPSMVAEFIRNHGPFV